MKRGWYKNKDTGEVVFVEGTGLVSGTSRVFVRARDRSMAAMFSADFEEYYRPTKASGFPSLKPKFFKPRYAVYDFWSQGEAFVMEFEPGKFKVVMKDGREILRDENTCKYFAKLFEDGSWKLVPEAEALARLDRPTVPAAEQFGPGTWYGAGLVYHLSSNGGFFVYQYNPAPFFNNYVGWVSYEVVQHLWDLGMVSKERPRNTQSIVGQASAVLDLPKTATIRPKDVKPKKVLVEWAIQYNVKPHLSYRTHLFPEGFYPKEPNTKFFKTGRTVEVPE